MHEVRVVVVGLVLLACSEGASVEATPPQPREPAVVEPGPAPERRVTIGGERIRLGELALPLRDPAAPGIVDVELRPSYAYVELREALAAEPAQVLVVEGEASVAAVRSVLASLPEGATLALALADDRRITLRGAVRGDRPLVRVARDRVELRVRDQPSASVPELAQVASLLAEHANAESIAVELPDPRPAGELLAIADAAARAGVRELIVALDHEPCVTPPAGMACVPGGFAIVGSDDEAPEEKPRRELELSTFYIDHHEITNADYDACHAAGACPRRINGQQNIMQPFVGPTQPVVPMDWQRAVRYCAWAGKRLPSEWEWEKAARGPDGDLYPWGDEPPTCELAQYRECAPHGCTPYPGKAHPWDCNEHDTKPVGSYPAGHYGLFDMAGNGYEWTASVGVEDPSTCGEACNGRDPAGPCDGAFPCEGNNTRMLRGGSWYWPAGRIRGAHRRVENIRSGGHRLSARCASDEPFLTAFPSAAIEHPREAPPDPEPASAEALAHFAGITQDPIEDKPICSAAVRETWGVQERGGRSETTCRDPFPYLESNEPRAWLWQPFLRNLGGAYLGVGGDQAYSFIAIARSEWAWVMDYDPRVVDHHRRMRAFILEAETPEQFIELWAPGNSKRALEVIERHHPPDADPGELAKLRRGYQATNERLHDYFREQVEDHLRRGEGYGWLANPEHYAYIRRLYQQGRIMPIKGDLLGKDSMRTVAAAARALGVAIRVFYTSNAPISWGGHVTDAYRDNVLGLPFDRRSIVLQTTAKGGFRQTGHWHYNVQWGRHMHARLRQPGYDLVEKMLFERIPAGHGDLTSVGLPSGIAD
ncbi:SUMF1/EgtB/PvdO family nonheme iron enzyme [Nannocystaceae bacterium ST9]